ncbi:5-oxopent-3-ene-1,2,5-tricarboxylate decarboxylase [Caballeronia choica]|uniref:5-oxopent-3-ene-1,2,5-tricarboxylate decarboxylase n=1 Tax=Caballeronia choica TaxID=326476 RepID=A0A158INJ0_9BURK|nr:fumarylacetoacetate hydrolase family protein [Caballeronia choica]SAL57933.1 5-oxopent-3-ene-1,2,5-tricarboxylate decarboxylase [Caballeronia choica]
MKFISFLREGRATYGFVDGDTVIDLAPFAAKAGATLKAALERGALKEAAQWAQTDGVRIALADVELLPVIPDPGKILCVGINYLSHVKETGREIPKHPMIFTRWADSQTPHGGPIVRPAVSEKLDFEGELAVIIGRTARHVSRGDALDFVAGYACYNDGSVRDWQKHTIQFIPGKNFPSTGGFGPCLVTADEVGDPSGLALTTRLNGAVVQQANTDDLIFSVAHLIEYCSTFTELHAGDVIITGTTGGAGAFREPPLWMKAGDVVEVEISKLGVLRNVVVDEAARATLDVA